MNDAVIGLSILSMMMALTLGVLIFTLTAQSSKIVEKEKAIAELREQLWEANHRRLNAEAEVKGMRMAMETVKQVNRPRPGDPGMAVGKPPEPSRTMSHPHQLLRHVSQAEPVPAHVVVNADRHPVAPETHILKAATPAYDPGYDSTPSHDSGSSDAGCGGGDGGGCGD